MSEKPERVPATALVEKGAKALTEMKGRLETRRFLKEMQVLVTLECEHALAGRTHCDYEIERPGCCDACYARRFAHWLWYGSDD